VRVNNDNVAAVTTSACNEGTSEIKASRVLRSTIVTKCPGLSYFCTVSISQ
jgi:cysteine sulfinate desulfinase/cysteine desulfurase-like protein